MLAAWVHVQLRELSGAHRESVSCLSYGWNTKERLVSAGWDRLVVLWHVLDARPLLLLHNAHIDAVSCVAVHRLMAFRSSLLPPSPSSYTLHSTPETAWPRPWRSGPSSLARSPSPLLSYTSGRAGRERQDGG